MLLQWKRKTSLFLTTSQDTCWQLFVMIGCKPDTVEGVVERRTLDKLLSIMGNPDHPLHHLLDGQRSTFSNRLIQLCCHKDRYRKSFLLSAITLYNKSLSHRLHHLTLSAHTSVHSIWLFISHLLELSLLPYFIVYCIYIYIPVYNLYMLCTLYIFHILA